MKDINNKTDLIKAYRDGELTPERNSMYWTEEEKNQLSLRFRDGIGITDLALEFQRSENGIVQQLMAHNLFTPPGRERAKRCKVSKCLCEKCDFQGQECCPRMKECEEGDE